MLVFLYCIYYHIKLCQNKEAKNGEKTTFVIDQTILEEAKAIVETKRFKSLNRFVEKAIEDKIERIRKEEIEKAIQEASRDPVFLSDIRDVEHDFEFADFEYKER
ncbi:MAG: hypothetical protein U9R17_00135 [Thermodesulfobacteriota bacterium]|nr:hypothetical protein [Thermodesulfobacteriota bacterium]